MNLRDIAKKVGSYISSKTQDDEGFFRQGKFTPVQQTQQITQPIQKFAQPFINTFKDQQSIKFGTNPTTGKLGDFNSSFVGQGVNNYKQNIKLLSDPATQEQFTSNVGPLRQAAVNYTLAPIAQIPYNIKQAFNKDKTGVERGLSGLNAALGVAQFIPGFTGVDDLIMAGVGGVKGIAKEQKSGKNFGESIKASKDYFTGQKYAGLGDLAFDDPTKQTIGNIAEIPLTILLGGTVRNAKNLPLGTQKDIERAQGELKKLLNSQEGVMITQPEQLSNVVDMLYKQDWRQIENPTTQTAIKIARYIKASEQGVTMSSPSTLGLTTKNVSSVVDEGVEKAKFLDQSQISPESKTIKVKPNENLVKQFDETIKVSEQPKIKVSNLETPKQPELKQRGFSASVQEAPDISKKTKIKVLGGYETKPNEQLMGEAKALLNEGVDLKNINKIENIDQKIAATIQEAINLDAAGKHNEAAALFNNLSELGTQVGRGTQAFSLLNKMSPEAISLSVAGKIKKYNLTHNKKLPELTGEQQKQLSKQVNEALKFPEGSRERGIAIGRVNETINSFIPSTIADKFITAWKAGLLSSLRTHERNIVGNVIMQTGEQASLYPASLADKLMSLKTGTRTLVPSQKGTIKGAIEGGQTAADVIKYGFDPMGTDIAKYEIKKVNWGNNPLEQALKKATDVVFNTLEAEDKVFWKSSYNRSLYNQAATEALNQGKKGDTKFIQQLFDNATEEMKKTAFNDANYSTFKDKNLLSGSIGQFKSWVNRQTGPAAEAGKVVSEMLMPFTGVPTSIVGKTIAYSPIGLVKGSIDFGRVVSGSEVPGLQRQAAQEIGRGVIGSGIFGLGSYLMSQGLMTGQAKDEKERKQWELEGKQENSVLVNGKWRSINSVGPQTLVLLAGAKFNEMQNDPEQNLGTYGFSMAKDQLNQTFLSGVQQPLSALNEPYKAKSYLGGQVASLVPNIIKDTSKAFDPLAREVDTSTIGSSIKGRLQQSIPFVRNKMIPQRDVLGNEIAQTPTGIGAYIDLFNSKTPISNNVINELSRLNDIGYNKTPTKLDKNQTIQGEKMTLNQAQLDRLEIVSGLATDKALNDLFNTTAYQSLNDAEKQDAIGDVITKTRKNVRAKINLKNIEEKSYTTSSDSQLAELGGFGMFTKAVTTNPKSAINALLTGNPIRKTSDGSIVVLERQNDIGSYDLGDTASQVDHIIPLSLGGTNEVRNLQILNNEEHAIKTKTDMYLLNQVKSGKMSLKDAQEKAKNWRDTALSIPKESQSQIIDEINSETAEKQSDGSQVYKIVSDAGNVTLVDLGTPIKEPKYTGFAEVDKKLKSSYKSAITKRINNIVKLYEEGQLSAEEAERYINELKAKSSSTGSGSTKSKGGKITIKAPKYNIPKISVKFQETPSTIKLKSAPKIKVSSSNQRKYTIKA